MLYGFIDMFPLENFKTRKFNCATFCVAEGTEHRAQNKDTLTTALALYHTCQRLFARIRRPSTRVLLVYYDMMA